MNVLRLWALESMEKKSKSASRLFIFTDIFLLLEVIVLDDVRYVLQAWLLALYPVCPALRDKWQRRTGGQGEINSDCFRKYAWCNSYTACYNSS